MLYQHTINFHKGVNLNKKGGWKKRRLNEKLIGTVNYDLVYIEGEDI